MTKSKPRQRESWEQDQSDDLALEDAGFQAQPPATTFLATLPPDLKATDGQTLGYTWAGLVENWHQRAFTSFGDGHGVWEKGGGALLPFYSRNFPSVSQWAVPVDPQQLMPTPLELQQSFFHLAPSTAPVARRLTVTPDRVQSHAGSHRRRKSPGWPSLTAVMLPLIANPAKFARDAVPIISSSLVQ